MLSSWKQVSIGVKEAVKKIVTHSLFLVALKDPLSVESFLPVFALAIVRAVVTATVDALASMGAVLTFRSSRDGRVALGLSSAARRQSAVEFEGVGFTVDGADLSLERTDMGVRAMSKTPASVALRNTRAVVCRGDHKTMFALHKVAAYKVAKVETRTRVSDIKPDGASIRTSAV